jgi:hypothetical protein
MNLSSGVKSAMLRICAMFDSSESCECTTPFGFPSDPDVNNTTAGSEGSCARSASVGNRWQTRIHSVSPIVSCGRRSSR